MATTREQFIALRKSGMTPVQAREEVMKTVTPTSPTANANVAQLEANKAKVQAEIQAGTRPEVGTSVTPQAGQTQAPTPVLPTAPTATPSGATLSADGTVTPATPAPATETTPTPAPETPKVETPAPTTPVTPTAVTPIVDKNAEIKAKNEAKLAENQQKAKLAEEQRQKGITEQNTALANNEGAILNTLKTGGMIPESVKTSPFYKSAQQTYNKLQQYSTYSTNELVTAMNQGSIVPGTNVYNEMMKDPAMKQKLTDAQVYRAGNPVNSTRIYENASSDILSNNPTTDNYLSDGVITQEEYDQATNNTQVVAKAKEVEEKANKYNTLKAEYDSIEDEVNAQFPGSPFADSIIADRQKAKYKNLVLAKGEWETATGTLTELKSQASTLFETNLNLAEKRREEQNTIASEQRAVQRSKDALQYEADFNKKQAEAALNDPAIAIKSVMDEMAKIGVSSTESLQTKIQKANEYIANGGTIGGYIDEMKKLYTEKPEYKAYLAKQGGTEWQSTNITRYNPATGANESTPVFYRKKTDGSFEAVDLSGNKIDASLIGGGGFGTGTGTPGTIPTSFSGDTTSYIASKEGFRDTAYQDSAGVWTIGYGTTKINGKPIQPGQKITQADAQKQLGADIAKHSNWKNYIDESTLSPSQRTALASFEYNLGPGIWDKGAVNIINMVKSGDLAGAGKEMQKYVNAGGKVIKGLQNRRAEEAKLLQSTGTSETPSQTYDPNKIKSFEAFNGTTFPSDYKTPAQQKQFREEYDAWRASRPGTRIESGNDILNIKIDKPTEGQSASQSYTSRMLNAVNNLMPLEKKFLELGTGGQVAQTYLPSLLKSSDQKMMDAEKKNFITAVLRKQSGASIAPSEFAGEEMKYFPQPGDSKEVVIAKQNARNAEIKAMLATAGVDAEGNSLSKYYNPPVIVNQTTTTTPVKTDKITTLKKNYFN